ncbi:MAG TPA: hypothetical protein VJ909_03065, partial [Prolixibacteraceae bacterium]|nr:hypothetical protein [Prolixibacteraceae bacterium]
MNFKKSISTLIFLLFMAGYSFSQNNTSIDTINQYNQHGEKTGYWEKYYDNGNIQYIGYFKNGMPVGSMKRYDKSGNLKATMFF